MIQINLLPDVKQQFVKARRSQRSIMFVSFIVAGVAAGIFILLFLTTAFWQKKTINDLTADIKGVTSELQEISDLDRVLTVQQQLKSLPELHRQKPAVKKLFGYLTQITPANSSISSADVDFQSSTIQITGTADNAETINKFVDTIKFTKYKYSKDSEEKAPFSNVTLSSFSVAGEEAGYTIDFIFDKAIFDNTATELTLIVPQNFITTRSETERPKALFEKAPEPETEEEN